ncbi:hypothetical protein CEXT_44381 [Caerostris extrusa]|uniref:Uncharacterized protein n=1 Tax=Caerostris extrusa TaxID=172846 RepID=A0AAV4VZR7_CAEEX|nr:hypothetical protein CEXT_44381 [Caerostris extrusa]
MLSVSFKVKQRRWNKVFSVLFKGNKKGYKLSVSKSVEENKLSERKASAAAISAHQSSGRSQAVGWAYKAAFRPTLERFTYGEACRRTAQNFPASSDVHQAVTRYLTESSKNFLSLRQKINAR